MDYKLKTQKIAKLALINEQLINLIPDTFTSKNKLISWLNSNPYSPYITLYGGEKALSFDKEKSFASPTDDKTRFILEDKTSFKLENFISFEDKILSANTKLSNVINSVELFKNYPEFKDLEISINISNANNDFYSGNTLYANNKAYKINIYASSNENAMRVLIHELQHCIQLKEGFKIGASYYNENGVMDLFIGLDKYQPIEDAKRILSKDTMFNDEVLFKEIYENSKYFDENKNGLKVKLIQIDPYDYIEAVNKIKPNHSHSEKKLQSLKDAYDNGIKVPVPYLTYGSRDEANSDFGQEGYNRAVHATYIGRKTIPVFVRYREDDENIPQVIKNAINFQQSAFSDIATKITMREISDNKSTFTLPEKSKKEIHNHFGFEYMEESKLKDFMELENYKGTKEEYIQYQIKKGYDEIYDITKSKYSLEEVLNHPLLYKEYPSLKYISVSFYKEEMYNLRGDGFVQNNEIFLKIDNPEKMKIVLLHEIQHTIQELENWAKGGNTDEFIYQYSENHKYNEELSTKISFYVNTEEYKILIEQNNNLFEKFKEKYIKTNKPITFMRDGSPSSDYLEKMIYEYKTIKKRELPKLVEIEKLIDSLGEYKYVPKFPNEQAQLNYLNLWGEQQARATQYRIEMSPEDRLKESWTDTLQRFEGKYNKPIIKYSENKNIFDINIPQHQEIIINHLKSINRDTLVSILEDKLIEDLKSKNSQDMFLKTFRNSIDNFKDLYNETKIEIISSLSSYENYIDLKQEKIYSDILLNLLNNDYKNIAAILTKYSDIDFLKNTEYSINTYLEKQGFKTDIDNNAMLSFVKPDDNEIGAFSVISNKQKMKEISDKESRILQKGFNELFLKYSTKIETLFAHDELFERYPFLKNIKIYSTTDETSYDGDNIFIADKYLNPHNKDKLKSVLLHEIQHVIQNHENWARGGNAKEFETLRESMQDFSKAKSKILKENGYSKWFDDNIDNFSISTTPKEIQELFIQSLPLDEQKKVRRTLNTLSENISYYIKQLGDLSQSDYEKYLNLLGEQQARAVQYRMNMSHDERLKESWTETLRKIEGEYKEPIIKYQNGISYFDNNKRLNDWHKSSSYITKKEDGNPKVFYHGTNKDITSFKGNTIWITESKDLSFEYALKNSTAENIFNGENILPVYVKANNLLEIRKPTLLSTEYDFALGVINNNISKIKNDKELKTKLLNNLKELNETEEKPLFEIWDNNRVIVDIFKDLGYDGIATIEANSRTIGVFEANQIKSIHNKGSFDISSTNILEKNDFGLRSLEMMLSIIPNNMDIQSVKEYLIFNSISHEQIRNTIYKDILNGSVFDSNKLSFLKKNNIETNSDYFQSFGEKESREIEDIYLEKLDSISEEEIINQNQYFNNI